MDVDLARLTHSRYRCARCGQEYPTVGEGWPCHCGAVLQFSVGAGIWWWDY